MKKIWSILWLLLSLNFLNAQEVLAPPYYAHRSIHKNIPECKLPFFDDFSNYQGSPNSKLWASIDPFVSTGYANLPPTIGTVTLDAVDEKGMLHKGASTSVFAGDTLLSGYVRLDSLFQPRKPLHPNDSVYLSFYYLPGGGSGDMWARNGDVPEEGDSLILEFYNPIEQVWQHIWAIDGISVDTLIAQTGHAWQFVSIPIKNEAFFHRKFQFRFRNYCTLDDMAKTGLIGNSDHWHLDYIYLNHNRHCNDEYVYDVAFVNAAPSFVKGYQAIPARQFKATDMCDSLSLVITNRYSGEMATRYTYQILDQAGNVFAEYDGGNDNAPMYFPNGTYQTARAHAHPRVDFSFPQSNTPLKFETVHVVRGSVANDNHPQNDTIRFQQVFDNYYAYDDGVAENGYGLTSTSSRLKLAYTFTLQETDTLTAIDLYFNPTRNGENEFIYFHLCIWDDNNGEPGNIIYKDTERRLPQFLGLNQYVRYILEEDVVVNGRIYIGFEQTSNDFINLGFDRNFDASNKIYYHTSGVWQQSILKGALMMRPYFGHAATVGIVPSDFPLVTFYPNPASHKVVIHTQSNVCVQLYDSKGRLLYSQLNPQLIDLSSYHSGVYFLKFISTENQATSTQKLIIR